MKHWTMGDIENDIDMTPCADNVPGTIIRDLVAERDQLRAEVERLKEQRNNERAADNQTLISIHEQRDYWQKQAEVAQLQLQEARKLLLDAGNHLSLLSSGIAHTISMKIREFLK